jgi:hypothetical protein
MRSFTFTRPLALAALACAFALVPAGSAVAGSGPAPKPGPSHSQRSLAPSTAPSAAGNPLSARAQAAGVCSDAYQIGTTGYIYRSGAKIASVKQFYSPDCNQNYGYLWVWDSYRNSTTKDYDVSVGVFTYTYDQTVGERSWANTRGQEFWSNGADTVNQCTAAVGSLRASGDPLAGQAASSKRC